MQKFCIVCGLENFSRSKNFCCEKCHQKYYYQKNKEQLLKKHNKHYSENKKQYNNNNKKWRTQNKEQYNKLINDWRDKNRKKYNSLALASYYKRKENVKENG